MNKDGSYDCECRDGFEWNSGKTDCENINECENTDPVCHDKSNCIDSIPSFSCDCWDGYEGVGLHGFQNMKGCVDKDECNDGTHTCDPKSQLCEDGPTPPSNFTCSCRPEFKNDPPTANPINCIDIDECTEIPLTHTCHADAQCINYPNAENLDLIGYTCKCNEGYLDKGPPNTPGRLCKDEDECLRENDCPVGISDCENTIGSYLCNCKGGYSGGGTPGEPCNDIDECTTGDHLCHTDAKCTNDIPSEENEWTKYRCECNAGYKGDGRQPDGFYVGCENINECYEDNECPFTPFLTECVDEPGSYSCDCRAGIREEYSYGAGYISGSLNGSEILGTLCTDINECDDLNYCAGSG